MSHFTVLVAGPKTEDELEQALLPYHEFECTGIEQYLQRIDITEEAKESYEKYGSGESFEEYIKEDYGYNTYNTIEEAESVSNNDGKNNGSKYGFVIKNEDGSYMVYRNTNPNKKWDWWVIGGRWSGILLGKDGNKYDQLRKGDVDIETMSNIQIEHDLSNYMTFHTEAKELFGDMYERNISTFIKWRDVNKTDAREFYHNQPLMSVKKILTTKYPNGGWFWFDIEDYLRTEEQVIADAAAQPKKFFAYLIDGKWYERGNMGWFACISNEDEDWNNTAIKLFDDISDDTIITVVDCHI